MYIPKSITYEVYKRIIIEGNEYPVAIPYCSLLYINKKREALNSNTITFDKIKIIASDDEKVKIYALVETDVGPVLLNISQTSFSNEELISKLLKGEIDSDGFLKLNFGFYSSRERRELYLKNTDSEIWKDLCKKGSPKDTPFKNSELEVGKIYNQFGIDRYSDILYLGKVSDPSSEGKNSYVFIDGSNIEESFKSFFKFEKQRTNEYRDMREYNRVHIKSKLPENLAFDRGFFNFSSVSINGITLSRENICEIIQDVVNKQWLEYLELVEYERIIPRKEKDYKIIQPPSWMTWQKRLR